MTDQYDDLKSQIANLEQELARRPVVWCAKRKDTDEYYQYLDGPRLFLSLEDALRIFGENDSKWIIKPYTG